MTEKLRRIMARQSETRERLNHLLGIDEPSDAETRELTDLRSKAQGLETELREALDDPESATEPGEPGGATVDPETANGWRFASGPASPTSSTRRSVAVRWTAPRPNTRRPSVSRRWATFRCPSSGTDGPRPARSLRADRRWRGPAGRAVRVRAVCRGGARRADAEHGRGPGADPADHDSPAGRHAGEGRRGSVHGRGRGARQQSPKRVSGQFEIRVEDLAVYAALEDVLQEAMAGALSNELDEEVFNGAAAGLNGLFTQAAAVAAASSTETYASGIARFAALIDGRHAYSLADVRAVIGPSTFALYAGLFANSNKGDMSLFDYLMDKLGSIRVSDRMPAVAGTAQKGIVTLNAGPSPIRVYVWSALELVRDPYSGAGAGKVTLTATALVSEVYIPHGTSQVKEIHPKLS